jgi:hypothetical protein
MTYENSLAIARMRLRTAKDRLDRAQAELSQADDEWREAYRSLNRIEDEPFIIGELKQER